MKSFMNEKIHIALVIPFYNEELYIQQTLQSLVEQRFSLPLRWTVVFVNNASTDTTEHSIRQVCKKHSIPFHLIKEQRKGTVYSRTTGLRYGASLQPEILLSTDADTTFTPTFIESTYLDMQNGDAEFLCGKRQVCRPVDLWKRLVSRSIYNTYRTLWNLEYELYGQYAFGAYFAIKTDVFTRLPHYHPARHVSFLGEDVLLARRCFYTGVATQRSSAAVTPNPRKDIALGVKGFRRMPGNTPETHDTHQEISSLNYHPLSKEVELDIVQQIYDFTSKRLLWSAADAFIFWIKTGMKYPNAYSSAQKTFQFFDLDIQSVDTPINRTRSTYQLYKKLLNSYESAVNRAIQQYVENTIR